MECQTGLCCMLSLFCASFSLCPSFSLWAGFPSLSYFSNYGILFASVLSRVLVFCPGLCYFVQVFRFLAMLSILALFSILGTFPNSWSCLFISGNFSSVFCLFCPTFSFLSSAGVPSYFRECHSLCASFPFCPGFSSCPTSATWGMEQVPYYRAFRRTPRRKFI